jgi:hypothetical protein
MISAPDFLSLCPILRPIGSISSTSLKMTLQMSAKMSGQMSGVGLVQVVPM